ncbi:hypothetical protein PtA15_8A194 [Puccinia triticina]|uniref:Uncharacterized protein n=1 Tax=Puccinia triticina TaxID=208348 RepID=A0ABY7CU35_9BASI|nr:uncharacterized protein PtA15_8A194 [Puccinia triticina]WAQ87290.1 hypothetical protein PtA15_8A194 [Puccinia triticina]
MVNMIYNGPARRPRVRTTPTQREILQQARFDQKIRNGQRLGAIPEAPTPLARPTNPTNDDITNPPDGANHQMPFEDNLQDPAWLDDDPIVAHASYHRMRRYAERREIISTQWTQLETQVTSAYLQCQRDTSNWTYQPQGLPAELCTCSSDDIHERQVDLIDILPFVKALAAFLVCNHSIAACSILSPTEHPKPSKSHKIISTSLPFAHPVAATH